MNHTDIDLKALPRVSSADEWRNVPEGEARLLEGNFVDADKKHVTLLTDDGKLAVVAVVPNLMFWLDLALNPLFDHGARRALPVTASHDGWETTPSGMLSDADVENEFMLGGMPKQDDRSTALTTT
jgi:hypothetical protein